MTYDELQKQMKGAAVKTKTPIFTHFELTPRCNLDCKMCYIHNQNSNAMMGRELSTETWKHIFDEAYDMGMMFAALTGGECLLRSDFKELYLHLWKKRVFLSVLTNGLLLNEEYVEFFKQYKPSMVQISLYGSNEEGYLQVTGHRGFEKAVFAIESLRKEKINVKVTVTPCSYIKDDLINIIQFCKDNKFNYNIAPFIPISKRENSEENDHHLSLEEIVELSVKRKMMNGPVIPLGEAPQPCGSGTEPPKGLICSAGACSAVVNWEGKMLPCTAIYEGKYSLLKMSYAEAWEKTKAAVSKMLLGAECVGCPYDDVCPKCPAIRLKDLYGGHCKPEVCELSRRLVAAGVKKLNMPAESCES